MKGSVLPSWKSATAPATAQRCSLSCSESRVTIASSTAGGRAFSSTLPSSSRSSSKEGSVATEAKGAAGAAARALSSPPPPTPPPSAAAAAAIRCCQSLNELRFEPADLEPAISELILELRDRQLAHLATRGWSGHGEAAASQLQPPPAVAHYSVENMRAEGATRRKATY